MIRVARVLSGAAGASAADDTVVLDHDLRHRRRIALRGEGGTEFLLDLPEATVLRDGDALVLEDGRTVAVRAAPEPLAEIIADDPPALARIAWHIGNRHLPAAISAGRLLIRRDHVIEEMVRGLGATVRHVDAPFEPEGGAYALGHAHHDAGIAGPQEEHDSRSHDHDAPSHDAGPGADHEHRHE
jgi:urease accessory protein